MTENDPPASVPLAHHATLRSRADELRRRPGPKSGRPECVLIGHAWVGDRERADWLICLTCEAVKPP